MKRFQVNWINNMVSGIGSERAPTWIFAAVGLFLLLIVVGLLVISSQGLPDQARPEVLQAQFSELFAFLKGIILDCPYQSRPELPDLTNQRDKEALLKYHKALTAWSGRAESRPDLLSHPAILGAAVFIWSPDGGTKIELTIRNYRKFEPSWIDSLVGVIEGESGRPKVGQPAVTHWHSGEKHVVQYIDLVLNPEGQQAGWRLLFDLDHLGDGPADHLDGQLDGNPADQPDGHVDGNPDDHLVDQPDDPAGR